jgi:hypothetical protein
MNNSSVDNGIEILRYIKFSRTQDGRCQGIIQVLANEDGTQPCTMSVVRDTAGEVMRTINEMFEVAS